MGSRSRLLPKPSYPKSSCVGVDQNSIRAMPVMPGSELATFKEEWPQLPVATTTAVPKAWPAYWETAAVAAPMSSRAEVVSTQSHSRCTYKTPYAAAAAADRVVAIPCTPQSSQSYEFRECSINATQCASRFLFTEHCSDCNKEAQAQRFSS